MRQSRKIRYYSASLRKPAVSLRLNSTNSAPRCSPPKSALDPLKSACCWRWIGNVPPQRDSRKRLIHLPPGRCVQRISTDKHLIYYSRQLAIAVKKERKSTRLNYST